MKKKSILKVFALFIVAGVIAVSTYHMAAAKEEKQTIYAGVYLDSVYVGGLTKEEAMEITPEQFQMLMHGGIR